MRPVIKETLSAREFLSLSNKNPEIIKKSFLVPAKLGSSKFGEIFVEYTRPVYKNVWGL